ncbi:mucin-binding protein, partial [Limosilactobacillus avium]|uniref:mucin-binding protein n=1 Tax=Limosilactobacillus avium TaxID=2991831 RepID=UPI0024B8B809
KELTVIYTKVADQIAQIIYRDVNDTDNTKWVNIDTSGDITGKAGSVINYDPQSKIQELVAKGYKLTNNGFPAGAVFDNDSNKTQTFYIDFIHGTTTVTPDKPGDPGKQINPNDPDPKGPKWPDGTDKDSLTKTISQTVHYVYANNTKAANDSVQSVAFKHTLLFDKVTGKQIKDLGWDSDSH